MRHQLLQAVTNALIFLYLGSSVVVGRPHISETKTSQQSSRKRILRGQNFSGNLGGLQNLLRLASGDDLQVVVDKRSNIGHLERTKRHVVSKPCTKPHSYQLITLPNGDVTYSVECKSNTLIACFRAIKSHFRTTKCLETRVVYSGRILVQDCNCAS